MVFSGCSIGAKLENHFRLGEGGMGREVFSTHSHDDRQLILIIANCLLKFVPIRRDSLRELKDSSHDIHGK